MTSDDLFTLGVYVFAISCMVLVMLGLDRLMSMTPRKHVSARHVHKKDIDERFPFKV